MDIVLLLLCFVLGALSGKWVESAVVHYMHDLIDHRLEQFLLGKAVRIEFVHSPCADEDDEDDVDDDESDVDDDENVKVKDDTDEDADENVKVEDVAQESERQPKDGSCVDDIPPLLPS